MPSEKPLIALRLEQALYDRVVTAAYQEGRTPANYIAQVLRISLAMTPAVSYQGDLLDHLKLPPGPEKRASTRKRMAARAGRLAARVAKKK